MYNPPQWVIVKITGDDPHYRVFGSWRGGYLSGDSWRMNSGITKVEEDDDNYLFHGSSGSVYVCPKEGYGVTSPYNNSILGEYVRKSDGRISIMAEMPDIMNMDWLL